MQEEVDAATANSVLSDNLQHRAHEFWPIDRTIVTSLGPVISKVRGHKQWTDAALLYQAAERDNVLVTFDTGIREWVPHQLKSWALLLSPGKNQVSGTT